MGMITVEICLVTKTSYDLGYIIFHDKLKNNYLFLKNVHNVKNYILHSKLIFVENKSMFSHSII